MMLNCLKKCVNVHMESFTFFGTNVFVMKDVIAMNDSFPHRCPYCGTYKIGLRALGIHMDHCATYRTKPMPE
jgi:hypothetical protein